MRPSFCLFLCLLLSALHAQVSINIYEVETEEGYDLFINNEEYTPVTVVLKYDLLNLKSSVGEEVKLLVPARAQDFAAGSLSVIDLRKPYQFRYEYETNIGNHGQVDYDSTYVYRFPFAVGEDIFVSQGYNGAFSHKGILALDFTVPVGTPIFTARGGVVTTVTEEHNRNCTSPGCMDFNNLIVIRHEDGTFAEYVHLRKEGAFVEVGDTVVEGQLIGESGNTGFSDGPHLHFALFIPRMEGRVYLPSAFKVQAAPGGDFLEVGRKYRGVVVD